VKTHVINEAKWQAAFLVGGVVVKELVAELRAAKAAEKPLYRGGSSLELRKGIDYKVGPDGLVNGKGISLNADKMDKNIQKYGGAFELNAKSIPEGLKLKPTSGTHYEIVPTRPMNETEFLNLMKQVELKPYNQL
jgi:hypothetical protein